MSTLINNNDHKRVLENCVDVPQQRPSFAIELTEVGISGKTVWVKLPEGLIPFQAKMDVNLVADVRGIHMSRMEEVVASLYDEEFCDVQGYGLALCRQMLKLQGAVSGRVALTGLLPHIRTAQASGKSSVDSIRVHLEVEAFADEKKEDTVLMGVGVNHITACPCTQVYNQILFDKKANPCPLPTHSQRSETTLWLECIESTPSVGDLRECLEQALHVTQDLLKRPDEAELVLQSHLKPQFAEDAVRETARQVAVNFGSVLPGKSRVIIESLSLESIHIHDVNCRLVTTLDEIKSCQEHATP